jgi:hypothetical protein
MSVKMMHMVFERFPLAGNDMVLALALADHAHDDGTNIFPGNERLAHKTRMSERTVIRLLQKFVNMGWLIKVKNSNSGRGFANVFCINPNWIKGDNLSPLMDEKKGDKKHERVTNRAQKGDITVSHQPSITINTTTTPRTREGNKQQSLTPQGEYASRLIPKNIAVTSQHPLLLAWVSENIEIEFIEQCVGLARQRKPWPERISAGYLDAIVRSELKPKQDSSWLMTDDGVIAKGREIGIDAKVGESMQDYRARLKAFIADGARVAA